MARKARIARKTRETDITVELNLDGGGASDVKSPIPFLDHMLNSLAKHGLFDLRVRAKGDIEVDFHHTIEDVGLCLGEAFKKAVGDKAGIRRCGSAQVPMMDSLASVVLDFSGRPYFKLNTSADSAALTKRIFPAGMADEGFDFGLVEEFMIAFANSSGADLHVTLHYAKDPHHAIEAVFKALGRALDAATGKDARIKGVMSTKGKL